MRRRWILHPAWKHPPFSVFRAFRERASLQLAVCSQGEPLWLRAMSFQLRDKNGSFLRFSRVPRDTFLAALHYQLAAFNNYLRNSRIFSQPENAYYTMAFNVQTFKTRSLSAVFFVIIMLAGLLVNHWTFLALFTIIHFGCWKEYRYLVGLIDEDYKQLSPFHAYGAPLLGWGFMLCMTNDAYHIGNFRIHELGWWLVLLMMIVLPLAEILFSRQLMLKRLGYSVLGLLYISLSWGLMIDLRNIGLNPSGVLFTKDLGWIYPVVLIASIWINDTMAYIVGSFIGKTPFSPISPKKTWEGTAGGAVLAVAAVTLTGHFGFGLQDTRSLLVISAIAAVVGTSGDLLESKLKRLAGVKDSGNMMPGHGGFLDRFDSLLLATPFVWLYIKLFV